jgi:hypothetical protein
MNSSKQPAVRKSGSSINMNSGQEYQNETAMTSVAAKFSEGGGSWA